MFIDKLIQNIKDKNSSVIAGLDPRIENIPDFIINEAFKYKNSEEEGISQALYLFNKGILDSIYDIVPAVKIQIAFYEAYGYEGLKAFYKTAEYAKDLGLIVIADVKRGDIQEVAKMYSKAYLKNPMFDAMTVNPYMGMDTLLPYLDDILEYNKGIFVLVKTSNKGSSDIQNIKSINGTYVYENVAEMIDEISNLAVGESGYSSVGAVVGATYPDEAKVLRSMMKKNFFLVPGYKAQGGTIDDIINCFDINGYGAVINSSRGIMYAFMSPYWKDVYSEFEYGQAAREEVLLMTGMINNEIIKKKYIAC